LRQEGLGQLKKTEAGREEGNLIQNIDRNGKREKKERKHTGGGRAEEMNILVVGKGRQLEVNEKKDRKLRKGEKETMKEKKKGDKNRKRGG
jgi:hypothetical protein